MLPNVPRPTQRCPTRLNPLQRSPYLLLPRDLLVGAELTTSALFKARKAGAAAIELELNLPAGACRDGAGLHGLWAAELRAGSVPRRLGPPSPLTTETSVCAPVAARLCHRVAFPSRRISGREGERFPPAGRPERRPGPARSS